MLLRLRMTHSQRPVSRFNQELSAPHNLLLVHPNVEVPTDHVDVRRGVPLRARVLPVWITERNVDPWELLVLQDLADHVFQFDVGPDRKFTDAVAILVSM